jgi:hypothetical protein|tara:strand:- start:550 stop:1008 length:459 start_codon:yes stop_codon:yes gene_type:complete
MTTKTSRSADTRVKTQRKRVWQRPSSLDAPPAPDGYIHRWIRAEVQGYQDTKNVISRLREGYELVRADEYPDWQLPTIEDGKHAGVIGVGGLLLARIPEELIKQRDAYYSGLTQDQIKAVDNDLLKDAHPSMPISKPDRQSRVTFGGSQKTE